MSDREKMRPLASKTGRIFWPQPAGDCLRPGALRKSLVIATFFTLIIAQTSGRSLELESPGAQPGVNLPATAILTVRNSGPITVNGAYATTGATILSGAALETSGQVAATISLSSQGTVDIAPGTTLTLAFAQKGALKVILVKGCASLNVLKGIIGEIDTSQGIAQRTDPDTGGTVSFCFAQSARRSPEAIVDKVGLNGLFGLGKAAALAIIGGRIGTVEGVTAVRRGDNPGSSAP